MGWAIKRRGKEGGLVAVPQPITKTATNTRGRRRACSFENTSRKAQMGGGECAKKGIDGERSTQTEEEEDDQY